MTRAAKYRHKATSACPHEQKVHRIMMGGVPNRAVSEKMKPPLKWDKHGFLSMSKSGSEVGFWVHKWVQYGSKSTLDLLLQSRPTLSSCTEVS